MKAIYITCNGCMDYNDYEGIALRSRIKPAPFGDSVLLRSSAGTRLIPQRRRFGRVSRSDPPIFLLSGAVGW